MDPQNLSKNAPKLRYIVGLGLLTILVGVVFYRVVEDFSFIDALYFSVITLTTIGYGDIVPQTDAGKLFTVLYVLIGIGIFAGVVNYILRRSMAERIRKRQKK